MINKKWAPPASPWTWYYHQKTTCSQEISISMVHASVILSCAFPPKIMLDKPPITEKLTNAWHLLNIHYSDTSSEFQKAERMLNQHSYSQSEPRRHIAARLGADENGTLGPDLKNIQRLLARDLRVRGGWGCVYRKEMFQTHFKGFSKTGASAHFTHPPTSAKVI